jgi:spermidine synthase
MPGARVKADVWITEYITPWDVYSHGVTRILAAARTPFQDMQIVETGVYGKALVLDGKWQSCTGDEFIYHEALVQPAMIAHGDARRALILGGGEGATAREILRWRAVERVVMVDLDGEVVEACRKHLPEMHQGAFDDPRVELRIADAIDFIESTEESWDVVISDLTDPLESGPSFQLFTKEHFEKIRRILAPGGVLVVQAGPTAPVLAAMHARVVATLRSVFAHVHAYTAHTASYGSPWGFALCTERPIDRRPDPGRVDRLLAEQTTGGLKMIDGETLLGLLQTPAHLRRAIAEESRVFTLADPPRFFGAEADD